LFGSEQLLNNLLQQPGRHIPSLEEMGFVPPADTPRFGGVNEAIIRHYHSTRDFPAMEGTTLLGLHLRFGTVSVRRLVQHALALNETFLGELIWREFFMQLLWHHPRLANQCSRLEYEAIRWRNNEAEFERWCAGQTGYPLVDAGMRQLNATGFMHNRVRMVVASFLVKHLLIDWRWGEAYFARKLLDYDLASNSGNWQWVAGCGCDAAPYFRIFNPAAQAKKFDGQEKYIRQWVPEYGTSQYSLPIVDHEKARQRCLAVYKEALQQKNTAQKANKLFPD
jgi:deoxyribodipyrimidine photo-lyase